MPPSVSPRILVLTSGGDAPGMNAAIRDLVKLAAGRGVEVLGVEEGYRGLMAGHFRSLTRQGPEGLVPEHGSEDSGRLGGTILGSARCPEFHEAPARAQAAAHMHKLEGLVGLVVIGGNGSLAGAHALASEHPTLKVVGIPASIDNDVGCTGLALGVDTALNTIVDACDRISDTARAHRRAFVVEVMGRECGYLTMASAVAAEADVAIFRERGREVGEMVQAVDEAIRRAFEPGRDKKRVLVIKSEGVSVSCEALVSAVQTRVADLENVEVRGCVLGHLVRGGRPSYQDRMIAGRLSLAALGALLEGEGDCMAAWQPSGAPGEATPDPSVRLVPLAEVLRETKAMLDGSSRTTQWRVQMLEKLEGVFAL